MLLKSVVFLLVTSRASALSLDGGIFDNAAFVTAQQEEDGDMPQTRPPATSMPTDEDEPQDDDGTFDDDNLDSIPPVIAPVNAPVMSPVSFGDRSGPPVNAPVMSPVSFGDQSDPPVNAPVMSPVSFGDQSDPPVNAPVMSPVSFGDHSGPPVSAPVFFTPPIMPPINGPAPPVLPPPEEEKSDFILKISADAQLQPIIDKFMAANPDAVLKGTFSAEPFGFAVAGVTETEVKMFANSCSNLVLDIFKLFQSGTGGGAVGEEGTGCVAKPPSGTITMEVKYDTFAYETHFGLWKLEGKDWTSMQEYSPPTTYPMDKQVATVQLPDGKYSFDITDMAHNGMATNFQDSYYAGGHFKLIETDSGKELYKGADFGTYVTVEFDIMDGFATVSNVKSIGSSNFWY